MTQTNPKSTKNNVFLAIDTTYLVIGISVAILQDITIGTTFVVLGIVFVVLRVVSTNKDR